MKVYQAKFFNVDIPKYCEEDTFSSFAKAEAFVLAQAKKHSITNPRWQTMGNETYFNHQFHQHPQEDSACYHGNIKEITLK